MSGGMLRRGPAVSSRSLNFDNLLETYMSKFPESYFYLDLWSSSSCILSIATIEMMYPHPPLFTPMANWTHFTIIMESELDGSLPLPPAHIPLVTCLHFSQHCHNWNVTNISHFTHTGMPARTNTIVRNSSIIHPGSLFTNNFTPTTK